MKLKSTLTVLALMLCGSVQAATVFAPTDQNVNFFTTAGSTTGLTLGMFDDSDTAFGGSYLNIDLSGDIATFSPVPIGQNVNYTVTNNALNTLMLTNNDLFSLALMGGTYGTTFTSPSSVVCSANTQSCSVSWNMAVATLVVDVQLAVPPAAVPVPAAAWLLSSGLLGLVGVSRRNKPIKS